MLVPYNVDVPMERWPFANWVLMTVTSVVSLGLFIAELQHDLHRIKVPSPGGSEITESIKKLEELRKAIEHPTAPAGSLQRGDDFRPWQLITYTLVHADPLHLIGNMVFLFCFGNAVNAKLGHGLFLGLYFCLGAVAGLAWLGLGKGLALVGASGAIMGIVGLFLVLYPNNDVSVFFWFTLAWMGSFEARSWAVALVGMAFDLLGTMFDGGAVAYVCHLGGELVGIAIGLGLVAWGLTPPSDGEQNLLQLWGVHPETKRRRRRRDVPLPISRATPGQEERPLNREDWT
jgi:membrane associated rhomboid family serine protease